MYRPQDRLFAFRIRRDHNDLVVEGISRRYTAITLIGLANEPHDVVSEILKADSLHDVCEHLLVNVDKTDDLGEVALTLWAARVLDHPNASKALDRLRVMDPVHGPYPTVELAWSLTSLCSGGNNVTDQKLAEDIAKRLIALFSEQSGLFPHWPNGTASSWLRSHVACFADLVYPIQALSYYYLATSNTDALDVARCCAQQMCKLQGPAGQWWWHFDVRTGRVIEKYPVYTVHQDAMAPIALFALAQACGQDYSASIEKGLNWLFSPSEITGKLVDPERNIIWRKVGRREPGKLVRGLQAAASCLHSSIRVPGVDVIFPAVSIDYESRPYHMGWILHAFSSGSHLRV